MWSLAITGLTVAIVGMIPIANTHKPQVVTALAIVALLVLGAIGFSREQIWAIFLALTSSGTLHGLVKSLKSKNEDPPENVHPSCLE